MRNKSKLTPPNHIDPSHSIPALVIVSDKLEGYSKNGLLFLTPFIIVPPVKNILSLI